MSLVIAGLRTTLLLMGVLSALCACQKTMHASWTEDRSREFLEEKFEEGMPYADVKKRLGGIKTHDVWEGRWPSRAQWDQHRDQLSLEQGAPESYESGFYYAMLRYAEKSKIGPWDGPRGIWADINMSYAHELFSGGVREYYFDHWLWFQFDDSDRLNQWGLVNEIMAGTPPLYEEIKLPEDNP